MMGNVVQCAVWCESQYDGGDLWWLSGGRPQTGFVTEPTHKEQLPDTPIQSRRAVERRRNRGRDGGPGPCGNGD